MCIIPKKQRESDVWRVGLEGKVAAAHRRQDIFFRPGPT